MNYSVETIAKFVKGDSRISIPGCEISSIQFDHRNVHERGTMFIAIKGQKNDGHTFIPELIKHGVYNFIVTDKAWIDEYEESANFILVDDPVSALQSLAYAHRAHFELPVVGITGSNGKTVIKEWLNSLLEGEFRICRSPKSFNSQIGVPVSVSLLKKTDTLAVFEAGISTTGEMEYLERMIQPTIGVFTNLGDAHDAGFSDRYEKLCEKMKLFRSTTRVVVCSDQLWYLNHAADFDFNFFTWSQSDRKASVYVASVNIKSSKTEISLEYDGRAYRLEIPFGDRASVENAVHCFCVCLLLNVDFARINERFKTLSAVAMRMEIKRGIENTIIVDDSYNSDLGSLNAALEQLTSIDSKGYMAVISDLVQNTDGKDIYLEMAERINEVGVQDVVLVGDEIAKHHALFRAERILRVKSVEDFIHQLPRIELRDKAILVKGARAFKFERLVKYLQEKQHDTRLEIDLQKLSNNLRYYRSIIDSNTKIMVMVKAFAYGSGGFEIAQLLQQEKADYLAVAYTDEGVSLRQRGIRMPIMVMSPTHSEYESIIRNNLEPEIYSMLALERFIDVARSNRHLFQNLEIHIKVDSGMHRLGFEFEDVSEIGKLLSTAPFLNVASVFTHLAASDDPDHDAFTRQQIASFQKFADALALVNQKPFMRHVLNSSGALRFPEYHMDMVRLGIGLYGFSSTKDGRHLQALGTLKSYILQIRKVSAGESIGYSRSGVFETDKKIATVAMGYADGLDRKLGNGKWNIRWNGKPCPIVGNVCMDMCMIDISDCQAQEGDEVIVFNGAEDIRKMADIVGTIPYEILTNLSDRVTRVYLKE